MTQIPPQNDAPEPPISYQNSSRVAERVGTAYLFIMKILVTGATGLVGKKLVESLVKDDHDVVALVRNPKKLPALTPENLLQWKDSDKVPLEAIYGAGAVINLVGENIASSRWTEKRKERLWNSRIDSTRRIVEAIGQLREDEKPKVLISASAVGFYGDTKDSTVDETAPAGKGYLAELCQAWEEEALKAEALGLRVVLLRSGVILSNDGGALKKMGPAVLGDGKQWMSWVHIDDEVRFIKHCLHNDSISGAYNLTAPNPVTNLEFTKILSKIRGFRFTVPVPAKVLKLALGEMSSMLLSSQKVLPTKTLNSGFEFEHSDIESALKDVYGK